MEYFLLSNVANDAGGGVGYTICEHIPILVRMLYAAVMCLNLGRYLKLFQERQSILIWWKRNSLHRENSTVYSINQIGSGNF